MRLLHGLLCRQVLPDGFCICSQQVPQPSRPEPVLGVVLSLRLCPYMATKSQTPFLLILAPGPLFYNFPVMFLGLPLDSYKLVRHLFYLALLGVL